MVREAQSAARAEVEAEVTEVEFATMSAEEIAAYVESGEPMDKAGAYAIQGRASRWIPRIRGMLLQRGGAAGGTGLRDAGFRDRVRAMAVEGFKGEIDWRLKSLRRRGRCGQRGDSSLRSE